MTIPKDISAVLSPQEVNDLLTRMKVAALLRKKATYREITKDTGAGAATIARISKNLQKGRGGSCARPQSTTAQTLKNLYAFGTAAPLDNS